ncbi:MAG: nitroreductase family protein [Anaerolineae bacterium]|nr:nitroreductase family protein [Anaerolineae bacterium]
MDKRATSEYPLHDLLQRRWSPRAFSRKAISTDVLGSLFEAARWSPSGGNEQPWRFLVTRNGETAFNNLFGTLSGRNSEWAGNAPILILTLAKTISSSGRPNRHAYYDLGQAVANLTAQATVHDLFVHQMGGYDAEKARALFNIPAEYDLVTVIAIGYYGDTGALNEELQQRETAGRVRKPLSEIVFDGAMDTPLALNVQVQVVEGQP